jgi:RNA polymerase sigma-70 factor (ECF subfamily)
MSEPIAPRKFDEPLSAPRARRPRPLPQGELSDHALVDRARRGADGGAFESLMRRYNRRLFRVARSIMREDAGAQDAVQEAYIRAFTHLDGYEPTGSFGAWLTRICVNEALMLRRRQRPEVSMDDIDESALHALQLPDNDEPAPLSLADSGRLRRVLEQAVDALPEVFRIVFVMRAIEQLSVNETAASLGINESTVKTRLHRANRRLRADLSRRLRLEQLHLFEFLGDRCDQVVAYVLARLPLRSPVSPVT